MDPNNPVIKLCLEGLKAESAGNNNTASSLYMQAWELRKDDLDSCIAAHYVARQQKDIENSLVWNKRALSFAKKIQDKAIIDFYPSLYINIASNLEQLGKISQAKKYYDLAEKTVTNTSLGSHGYLLLESIQNGQLRCAI